MARASRLLRVRQAVKAAMLRLLVHLGAAQLVTAGDDVYRRFLAALEAAHHRIDHAVVDQWLQTLGYFHGTR
jgi:hypothetical protein